MPSKDSDQHGQPPNLICLCCPAGECLCQHTAKTLIRRVGCPGWSESLLGAQVILLVLLWSGTSRDCQSWSWSRAMWFLITWLCGKRLEPCHEIIVLRKLFIQMLIHSHPVGLNVWFLFWPFIYFHTSCVRTAKALARLRGCAGSPEPSLVAYVISTIISWVSSFVKISNITRQALQSLLLHQVIVIYGAELGLSTCSMFLPHYCPFSAVDLPNFWFEPPRDKTNKVACAPSEDSDQLGHSPSLIRVFAVRSMGS